MITIAKWKIFRQNGRFILKWTSHDPDSEGCFKVGKLGCLVDMHTDVVGKQRKKGKFSGTLPFVMGKLIVI